MRSSTESLDEVLDGVRNGGRNDPSLGGWSGSDPERRRIEACTGARAHVRTQSVSLNVCV